MVQDFVHQQYVVCVCVCFQCVCFFVGGESLRCNLFEVSHSQDVYVDVVLYIMSWDSSPFSDRIEVT